MDISSAEKYVQSLEDVLHHLIDRATWSTEDHQLAAHAVVDADASSSTSSTSSTDTASPPTATSSTK